MKFKILILFVVFSQLIFSQNTLDKIENLDSVIINSQRIELPFSKNSRTLTLITKSQIINNNATSIAELLQNYAGIDVRRRGLDGMQADLYIRGGSFDQTLLLIDGIKVEDPQTGHHTLNSLPALENIERIEIIKGPAARIFGQNAFTGAINIITKKITESSFNVTALTGSFNHVILGGQLNTRSKRFAQILSVKRNTSSGYRFNTDFKNTNLFYKSNFKIKKLPIQILATLSDRNFGANGFYASPSFINQYEETQASLVGLSSKYAVKNLTLKSTIYWKRNQDMYVFIRHNPSFFRNFHITNKVGAELNASLSSKAGITGFGVDVAKVYIVSNNLGNHDRVMTNVFLEHRFTLDQGKIDITPGVAVNYFSDFNFHVFPGLDVGYEISNTLRIYGNIGYTYRIPTYTDLYFNSPTTTGNVDLKPESAFAQELGFKYNRSAFRFNLALFNRNASDLIDYIKYNETDRWQSHNLRNVTTRGVEINTSYNYYIANFKQTFNLGYTYLDNKIKQVSVPFSRYSLNSIKHQLVASYNFKYVKYLSQNMAYRFVERPDGTHYTVVDAKLNLKVDNLSFSIAGNNLFNTVYTETNLVPMPKSNYTIGFSYIFK